MYRNKKFLAIIPARSGSKGLKHKNIKELNGKPMIAYTINAAKKSNIFDDIIVSTDSQLYADIAIEYGASVPFLRSKKLSKDEIKTNDVVYNLIQELSSCGVEYDYFMILQPTTPLRNSEDIIKSRELLFEKDANAVISVCESEHSPLYMNTIDESLLIDDFLNKDTSSRRQDLPKFYRLNGAIYLSKIDYFLKYRNLYESNCYAYIMDRRRSVDVDDELDFVVAEALLNIKL